MRQRKFFVLYYPCKATQISSMIGRVVADKYDPNNKFAPDESLSPSSILPDLNPEPHELMNCTEFL